MLLLNQGVVNILLVGIEFVLSCNRIVRRCSVTESNVVKSMLDDDRFATHSEAVMSNPLPRRFFPLSLSRLAGTAALLAVALASPMPAAADSSPFCAPRQELLKQLSQRYHEAPVALGLSNDGSLIEVLTSEDGSTWTIMVSQPNGASCLIAAGEAWEMRKPVSSGERGA
jgi:hypothetical protein